LNIELIDNQGTQIQATFFNDQADKYDELLQENKVYTFSNGTVKMANQKYTSIKNDFCIVFDRNSEIKEVADD
jgi:replication factor A1